jgi:hypothetical protein
VEFNYFSLLVYLLLSCDMPICLLLYLFCRLLKCSLICLLPIQSQLLVAACMILLGQISVGVLTHFFRVQNSPRFLHVAELQTYKWL